MSNTALSSTTPPSYRCVSGMTRTVTGVLVVWFALMVLLGAAGAFVTPLGTLPLPIAIGAVAPVVVFLVAMRASHAFREFVLAADLRLLTGIQAWRFAGFGFLALQAHGVLPGLFACPAGLGDMAIGLTAPWLVVALLRRPAWATSRSFAAWNMLGILDLVVAVSTGALGSGLIPGITGAITTRPMAQLPLVLIPAYLVPLFAILHLTVLSQSRYRLQR